MGLDDAASCSLDAGGSCRWMISPMPIPVPRALAVSSRAAERRVLLVDSRKPNSAQLLGRVAARLRAEAVEVELAAGKKNITGAEDSARHAELVKQRGLILLGVFD